MTPGGAAYRRVLDEVGGAIVGERWPAGRVTTIDRLVATTGVSRTIVREVTRELAAAGLLAASPRTGLTVLPRSEWDLLDLRVVQWRLAVGDRLRQLEELRDLRAAIEPEAAALAALRRSEESVVVLSAAAGDLERARGSVAFLEADRRFHHALIEAAGNAMFAALDGLVGVALEDRALVQLAGRAPESVDVRLHVDVADAVGAGDSEVARAAMGSIVRRATPAG